MKIVLNKLNFDPKEVEEILSRYATDLQNCRNSLTNRLKTDPFGAVVVKYFEGGKMFRPLLVFITTSALGGRPTEVIEVAEAIEMLHVASLIHDDIIDDAAIRRRTTTLHTQFNINTAIVIGDYLLFSAFNVLNSTQAVFTADKVLAASNALSNYAKLCCRGQLEELLCEPETDSEENYLSIARNKTGSPFAAAATLGGILLGGTDLEISALQSYGFNLGIAYQIYDDMLDLTGDSQILGKPVSNSLMLERPILPLIYLQKYGSQSVRKEYRRLQQAGYPRLQVVALLEQQGIFEQVSKVQEKYLAAALTALNSLNASREVDLLRTLALFATAR
ncbi:MAG: polyprenyl synthetase family protein [Calothrix sp. C42_A2020_038]|nr:polyprenyl synthetase family protein [Calothrix sp. C42_A2020_038]